MRSKVVDLDKAFGEGVKRLRQQRGLTQDQLTAAMADRGFGFYQTTVYKVETGQRRVSVGEAIALAQILGATVEELAALDSGSESGAEILKRFIQLATMKDALVQARIEAEAELARARERVADLTAREQGLLRELTLLGEVSSDGERKAEA